LLNNLRGVVDVDDTLDNGNGNGVKRSVANCEKDRQTDRGIDITRRKLILTSLGFIATAFKTFLYRKILYYYG